MKKKKLLLNVLFTIFIIIMISSSAFIIYRLYKTNISEKKFNNISSIDKPRLVKEYPNLKGWIKIEGTNIDYPVLMPPEDKPSYYLNHDPNGNYSFVGTPFIDPITDEDSFNTIIYGHHMLNKTMFGELGSYQKKDYYKNHKTVNYTKWFNDDTYKNSDYKIYACFKCRTDDKDSYLDYVNIKSEKEFDKYINMVESKKLYDTGNTPKFGDDMITLSTCSYHTWGRKGRFILIAYKD